MFFLNPDMFAPVPPRPRQCPHDKPDSRADVRALIGLMEQAGITMRQISAVMRRHIQDQKRAAWITNVPDECMGKLYAELSDMRIRYLDDKERLRSELTGFDDGQGTLRMQKSKIDQLAAQVEALKANCESAQAYGLDMARRLDIALARGEEANAAQAQLRVNCEALKHDLNRTTEDHNSLYSQIQDYKRRSDDATRAAEVESLKADCTMLRAELCQARDQRDAALAKLDAIRKAAL